jgi:hypothetical protein
MIRSPFRRGLACTAAIGLLYLAQSAGSALAAYPPVKPSPRATCFISTIVGRRVAVSCTAGKARAGKGCSLVIKKTVVARGRISRDGRYFARFTVGTLLTRGTKILFRIQGKPVVTLRV